MIAHSWTSVTGWQLSRLVSLLYYKTQGSCEKQYPGSFTGNCPDSPQATCYQWMIHNIYILVADSYLLLKFTD